MDRLLLVEDDPTLIRMLTSFLSAENFQVSSVTGQSAAVTAMEENKPDLALVDISLAEGNGFGVCAYAKELGIGDSIFFHGMQKNPYRFMKNADLFLLTSRHEAAPMVFDEARCLGLPILTTDTCSAHEMVTATGAGWVCENSAQGVCDALEEILADPNTLSDMRSSMTEKVLNNAEAVQQFRSMLKGVQHT